MAWIFSQLANYAKLHKLLSDVTGWHYNAGNSDVLLARAPPVRGKEERTDDISDYVFLWAIALNIVKILSMGKLYTRLL